MDHRTEPSPSEPTAGARPAAGFGAASDFDEAVARLSGSTPTGDAGTAVLTAGRLVTPLGPMLAVTADAGLVVLDFIDRTALAAGLLARRKALGRPGRPAAVVPGWHPHLDAARRQVDDYFAGRRWSFDLPLHPLGTAFDRRAWAYLATIPPGHVRSYGQQATALGSAAAARAVGRANGRNLLALVVPCHRVVGAAGHLTGYGGGTHRKAWLLRHERAAGEPGIGW